jgi:hypothetical protein
VDELDSTVDAAGQKAELWIVEPILERLGTTALADRMQEHLGVDAATVRDVQPNRQRVDLDGVGHDVPECSGAAGGAL